MNDWEGDAEIISAMERQREGDEERISRMKKAMLVNGERIR